MPMDSILLTKCVIMLTSLRGTTFRWPTKISMGSRSANAEH